MDPPHMNNSLFQGGNNVQIDAAVQNLEEEEEIADQKRRQEEIQSLLTKALDDFNYDDQSTINSSANCSIDYGNKYKEIPIENQLELLYNVRVKEVDALSQQLKAMEQQIADVNAQSAQKLLRAEAENDNLRISLKNAQELIVEKCGLFERIDEEKRSVVNDLETMRKYLTNLEQENGTLRYSNEHLIEQVAILENGRGANPLSDGVVQEKHHLEVTKLQDRLENAVSKIQRIEKENLSLTEELNSVILEKEDLIANKSEVINRLIHNVEEAQERNEELLGNVNRITGENEQLKGYVKELENNVQLIKGFTDKTEIIKILQKELDKMKKNNEKHVIEIDKLHRELADVVKNVNNKDGIIQTLEDNIRKVESKSRPTTEDNSMQTSKLMESFTVSGKLRDEILEYKEKLDEKNMNIKTLEEKLQLLEDDIINLNKKLELSSQRDVLTIKLQEKALKLEQIILNHQKPTTENKSVNTEHPSEAINNYALYKVQFEGETIEREIQLRKQLQTEFEKNYEVLKQKTLVCLQCQKLLKQLQVKELQLTSAQTQSQLATCHLCCEMSSNLSNKLQTITQQEEQLEQFRRNQENDRELIVQILEEWKQRFKELELDNHNLKQRLDNAQTELSLTRKSEETLMEAVKEKTQRAIKKWQKEMLHQVHMHNQKVLLAKDRIERISKKTDTHIKEIERNFSKTQLELKLFNTKVMLQPSP